MLMVPMLFGSPPLFRDPFLDREPLYGWDRAFTELLGASLLGPPVRAGTPGTSPRWRDLVWGWVATDATETEDGYLLTLEAPGFAEDDLEVWVERGTLRVRGERRHAEELHGATYHLSERRFGHFERAFVLPSDVDTDRIEVRYRRGVVEVELPKRAVLWRQRLKISKPKIFERLARGRSKPRRPRRAKHEAAA